MRLLVLPAPEPDPGIAEAVWRAVREDQSLRIRYTDVGGVETEREVEPQHLMVGPHGSYLTAWCHLRGDDRVFRLDRITHAEAVPRPGGSARAAREPVVDGHETRLPAMALRPAEDPANTPARWPGSRWPPMTPTPPRSSTGAPSTGASTAGDGEPFAPAGRVFREWIAVPAVDRDLWRQVLAEAVDFARRQVMARGTEP